MRRHFEHGCRGRNLVAEIVAAELRVEQRIITSTAGFVAFVPFASGYPYEIWIAPRPEIMPSSFLDIGDMSPLAGVLLDCLHRLVHSVTGAYNIVLHLPPVGLDREPYAAWWLQIVPRCTIDAGFEICSGLRINPVPPEEGARVLRNATQREANGE